MADYIEDDTTSFDTREKQLFPFTPGRKSASVTEIKWASLKRRSLIACDWIKIKFDARPSLRIYSLSWSLRLMQQLRYEIDISSLFK